MLGKMTWASMPHSSSTSRRTFGVVRADVDLVDRPLVERDVGALLRAVAVDDAAGAVAARAVAVEHPRRLAVDLLHAGHPVLVLGRRQLVKRSGGSVQWESASMMSMSLFNI